MVKTNLKNGRRYGGLFLRMALLGILTFGASAAVPGPCRATLVDRIVAIVNDDIILLSDLEKAVAPHRARLRQSGYSDARINIMLQSELPELLEELITDKLTDQQARRYGIRVSEAEIDETIARVKQMHDMTDEDLGRMLQMEGLTYDTYRNHLKDQLLRSRIVNIEVKSRIVITEETVRAYYEANRERFAGQTQYHLRHILMRVASPSQSERERVLEEIKAVQTRLQNGEPFERLARLYSQAVTAKDGGDLGLFESRLLADPVREALQGLEAGRFTSVVETEQGYQLFYIEEVVHSGGRSLEEMREEIQDKLYAELVDQRFEAWLASLRQRAHIQIIN